jgi:plastocyanin
MKPLPQFHRLFALGCAAAALGAGLACFSERAAITAPSGGQCQIPLDPNLLGSTIIVINNFAFFPAQTTVKAGTKVTWANCDLSTTEPHTSSSDTGVWDSGNLSAGPPAQIYSFTFSQPGSFAYHCAVHPSMQATVVVQ